jgi:hypothetical protein
MSVYRRQIGRPEVEPEVVYDEDGVQTDRLTVRRVFDVDVNSAGPSNIRSRIFFAWGEPDVEFPSAKLVMQKLSPQGADNASRLVAVWKELPTAGEAWQIGKTRISESSVPGSGGLGKFFQLSRTWEVNRDDLSSTSKRGAIGDKIASDPEAGGGRSVWLWKQRISYPDEATARIEQVWVTKPENFSTQSTGSFFYPGEWDETDGTTATKGPANKPTNFSNISEFFAHDNKPARIVPFQPIKKGLTIRVELLDGMSDSDLDSGTTTGANVKQTFHESKPNYLGDFTASVTISSDDKADERFMYYKGVPCEGIRRKGFSDPSGPPTLVDKTVGCRIDPVLDGLFWRRTKKVAHLGGN